MKTKILILFTFLLVVSSNVFSEPEKAIDYPTTDDPNIIIYSESHGLISYVKEKTGVLKLGISTFSLIRQIDINGKVFDAGKTTKAEIEYPFILEEKTGNFQISVVTEDGLKQETFVVHLGEKPKPKKKPYRLIGVLGFTHSDNVKSAPENRESGTKMVLTFVPQYDIPFGKKKVLQIKGIVLREKFDNDEFSASEVSFTQVAVQWGDKDVFSGALTLGLGFNQIKNDNDSIVQGNNETAEEVFLVGSFKQKFLKAMDWNIKMEYKLKDSKTVVSDINDEADARAASLKAGLGFKAYGIKGSGTIGHSVNDATGKYQDSTTTNLSLGASYPLGDFTPGIAASIKEKTMKEIDPRKTNVNQIDKASTFQMKASYKMWPKVVLGANVKSKKQTSNVAASEHEVGSASVTMTVIF